jgi:hypothetical protein
MNCKNIIEGGHLDVRITRVGVVPQGGMPGTLVMTSNTKKWTIIRNIYSFGEGGLEI